MDSSHLQASHSVVPLFDPSRTHDMDSSQRVTVPVSRSTLVEVVFQQPAEADGGGRWGWDRGVEVGQQAEANSTSCAGELRHRIGRQGTGG